MQYFQFYRKENHLAFTQTRRGELKLGERVQAVVHPKRWQQEVRESTSSFVMIGITALPGNEAPSGWPAFLSAFFNFQHNAFLDGSDILLLGYLDFSELQQKGRNKPPEYVSELQANANKQIALLIRKVQQCGKVPIIIGANWIQATAIAEGLAAGLSDLKKTRSAKINALCLSSYAGAEVPVYTDKFGLFGVQEYGLSQPLPESLQKKKQARMISAESVFVREERTFANAAEEMMDWVKDRYTLIGFDPSVLYAGHTASGLTAVQARQWAHKLAALPKIAGLQIFEGNSTADASWSAYLLADFIKASKK